MKYQISVDRTTVYEVEATDEGDAIERMMAGEATETDTETTNMRAEEIDRCESRLSNMRCELPTGHGRYHKSGTAGWDDGA